MQKYIYKSFVLKLTKNLVSLIWLEFICHQNYLIWVKQNLGVVNGFCLWTITLNIAKLTKTRTMSNLTVSFVYNVQVKTRKCKLSLGPGCSMMMTAELDETLIRTQWQTKPDKKTHAVFTYSKLAQ